MVIIGVDPAYRKKGFGVCILDITKNSVSFVNITGFIDFMLFVDSIDYECIFSVENSNMQNTSFDLSGNKNEIARKSRNVGMNQAISQLVCDYINYKKYDLIEISPKRKGSKWTDNIIQMMFKKHDKIYNYKGLITEQDKRDAYKIALFARSDLKY